MSKSDRETFNLLRRRMEAASMKFSIEVYSAFADAERVMNGEEPLYPLTGVYVARDEARLEDRQERTKKAAVKDYKEGDPYP